jgi:hypothetical protein
MTFKNEVVHDATPRVFGFRTRVSLRVLRS